jgi:hypothetical protein
MDAQWLDGLWPLPAAGLCRAQTGFAGFPPRLLPAMLACGLIGWWLNYRRYRLIADTPTARAASAALGHVELYGIAANHDSTVNYSPTPAAAVWYRCWRYHNDRQAIGSGRTLDPLSLDSASLLSVPECSDQSFVLQDGKQTVIIHPEGAEVQPPHRESWQEGNETLVEEWIDEGDPLYVLGQLTATAARAPISRHSARMSAPN